MVTGKIIEGRKLARQLDFPTANIKTTNSGKLPFGVYVVKAWIDGKDHFGVANLGVRPSVETGDAPILLETHLFDFAEDIYGKTVSVKLLHFLRREQKFPSLDELSAQITKDAQNAKDWLLRHKKMP